MRGESTPSTKEQVLRFMVFGGYEGSGQIDSRSSRDAALQVLTAAAAGNVAVTFQDPQELPSYRAAAGRAHQFLRTQ